jgi:hypothetical protein
MPQRLQRRPARAVQDALPRRRQKADFDGNPARPRGRHLEPERQVTANRSFRTSRPRARPPSASTSTARSAPTTSPARTGEKGIDNQMYRAVGCVGNYRGPDGSLYRHFIEDYMQKFNFNRFLIELTDVDSLCQRSTTSPSRSTAAVTPADRAPPARTSSGGTQRSITAGARSSSTASRARSSTAC